MTPRRVLVDLTPVLPGGRNGGVKLVALTLVRELGRLAPATEFTLITAPDTHMELADLDAANVSRSRGMGDARASSTQRSLVGVARTAASAVLDTLPAKVADPVWQLARHRRSAPLMHSIRPDLLFCPFTSLNFADSTVPSVVVVHDLQPEVLPQFFNAGQRRARRRHLRDVCSHAQRVICDSDFVRRTVLSTGRVPAERTQTIHLAALHAVEPAPDAAQRVRRILERVGVRHNRYLLYPANPWPHKNHARLLEAFGLFRRRWPEADLGLVCTGELGDGSKRIEALANATLPPGDFGFAGFLDERDFSALLTECRALMFPSLYEGFGMPLLEAMARGRPVLCSNAASLPEVAGNAALMFDPRDPRAIAESIERLDSDASFEAGLIERGYRRVAHFGTARDVAAHYLSMFEDVVRARG